MYSQFIIEINCSRCNQPQRIKPNAEGFVQWIRDEALIQDAMPELTAGEREMFLSGTCDSCWNILFPHNFSEDA